MVFSAELNAEFERRIDKFFDEWKMPKTATGYRYSKETVAFMIANPGEKPYTAIKKMATKLGIKETTIRGSVGIFVSLAIPPKDSIYNNGEKLRTSDFLTLCMNTVLEE